MTMTKDDGIELPGFLFVDHVAIAVRQGELEGQVASYRQLGFREVHREEVLGTDQVREVLLQVGEGPNLIQLLEPLSAASPVEKLIERNGGRGGFAHVAFRVRSAQAAFDYMKDNGFSLIDKAPRPGSRGTTVFFVHPKSRPDGPFGYLIEVVEDPSDPPPSLPPPSEPRPEGSGQAVPRPSGSGQPSGSGRP